VGECGALRCGGEIHVVFAQQDLILQVMMKDLDSASLTGNTSAFPDPFPQEEFPIIPIRCSHYVLSILLNF
jgi:hypothetical protein